MVSTHTNNVYVVKSHYKYSFMTQYNFGSLNTGIVADFLTTIYPCVIHIYWVELNMYWSIVSITIIFNNTWTIIYLSKFIVVLTIISSFQEIVLIYDYYRSINPYYLFLVLPLVLPLVFHSSLNEVYNFAYNFLKFYT